VLLVGSAWVIDKKGKLRVPKYLFVAISIYLFFLAIGLFYQHDNLQIDIKFQIFAFLFYLFLLNQPKLNLLEVLFYLNITILVVYILIFTGVIPNNIWHSSTVGYKGRVYGPSIVPIVLIAFYYLFNNRSLDAKLAISYLVAIPYLLFTTNLMNIVTAVFLLLLIMINIKKMFQPKYVVIALVLIVASLLFFRSEYAPELIKDKIQYVVKPWEYASLKIRIEDLEKANKAERFGVVKKIIGEGFGASTTIYRKNEKATSWSRFYTFQEIDNGFYYLYHRGGYLLLVIFFITHFYLFLKLKNNKSKLGFILVVGFTCLLSIHYFNNMFYLLIPFLILEREQNLIAKTLSEK
jgi:hypothetical protein